MTASAAKWFYVRPKHCEWIRLPEWFCTNEEAEEMGLDGLKELVAEDPIAMLDEWLNINDLFEFMSVEETG